jgi:hypothetical protein
MARESQKERRDRKERERDKKRAYKLAKYTNRNTVIRQTNRTNRKAITVDGRVQKATIIQEGRTNRTKARKNHKDILAEQGIDPNAGMYEMIGGGIETVGNTVGSIFGGGGFRPRPKEEPIQSDLLTDENGLPLEEKKGLPMIAKLGIGLLSAVLIGFGGYKIFKK